MSVVLALCALLAAVPSVELLVRLAKKHPAAFGYVKEEAAGNSANERMVLENAAKPAMKRVLSGWGEAVECQAPVID